MDQAVEIESIPQAEYRRRLVRAVERAQRRVARASTPKTPRPTVARPIVRARAPRRQRAARVTATASDSSGGDGDSDSADPPSAGAILAGVA
jgi:hypothetical protein